ncbi:SDR family NAD(P)-dependent oxidoreductase [Tumebacillus permanentifrigoris]|uniref:Polyketide synthase PksN n=1 Tax=Tumebacillus permanentifrigoris TaxID=378543 RepID=A0A316DFP2_9BACL|nr:SDR family NAD(P)-dependent oxidoreductase [Tumebacillus permanentifrigoris]PWK14994.1 polyketide synthase PksN [Tumebacillus permanentifrigoris]
MSSQTQKTFVQRVLHSNYIVRDHTVHEVRTLPGVTLLDMVYRLAPKYLGTQKIELRNILFIQPVVTSEVFDKKVSVTFTPHHDHWKVNISSQKVKGDTILEDQQVQNMECRMYRKETATQIPKFDVQGFINRAVRKYDMDDVYAMARQVKIHHDTFMKTLGTVYQSEQQEELMQLGLSGLAEEFLGQFYAHVAFLDGSTFSGSSYTLSHQAKGIFQDGTAYIPFMFQRVCMYKTFPKTIYVYTKQNEVNVQKDIVNRNVTIFDETGDVLAELEQLTFKRIREPHLIRKLIEWTPEAPRPVEPAAVRPIQQAAPAPTPAPAVVQQGDALEVVISYLQQEIAKELNKPAEDISIQAGFYELGLDSSQLLDLVKVLEEKVKEPLYPTLLFEYSTVETLAEYVRENWASVFTAHAQPQVQAQVSAPTPQAQVAAHVQVQASAQDSLQAVISYLQAEIGTELNKPADDISIQAGFYELGLDSSQLLELVKVLEEKVKEPLYPTLLFEYTTIETLAEYVKDNWASAFQTAAPQAAPAQQPIAAAPSAPTPQVLEQAGQTIFFERVWSRQEVVESVTVPPARRHVIVFYDGASPLQSFVQAHTHAEIVVLQHAKEANLVDQFEAKLKQMVLLIQSHLKEKKQQDCFLQIVAEVKDQGRYVYALEGLLKTAALETPKIHTQIVGVDSFDALSQETMTALLEREARHFGKGTSSVHYRGKQLERHVHQLGELHVQGNASQSPYQDNGVYVITGGLGGLGLMVAHHMASLAKVRLALIGRSKLSAEKESSIRELTKKGAQVLYLQADLANESETLRALRAIRERWGTITGIHHCAGVVRDQFLVQKNPDTIREVVQPKLKGLWNLDQVLRDEQLDFLVLYSSISAVIGNLGQSDYASANVFLDLFAEQRNELAAQGKRHGKCISVNWPLWADGGMQIDADMKNRLFASTGLLPMPSAEGLAVLDASLQQSRPQVGVFYGDEALIRQKQQANIATAALEPVAYTASAAPAQALPGLQEDIAIIGVSGRYPMANSMEELYANLKAGKDCVTGLPKDRWNDQIFPYEVEDLYQHGGFVDKIDEFDPIFFNISPYQAEMMDPQARLFLQSAWEACEDAGFQINRNKHEYASSSDRSVGVFAGVFWNHYELYAAEMTQQGTPMSFGIGSAQIPNMVSYSLNLHGPSLAVDTMCSSSLTAIHLASDSIRRGECQFAIAGGVNLVTHPHKYLFLKRAQFLSSDGRCRSFGKDGDGYVPGEGVGTLLLTTVSQAEKEGYPIYGVIKGSALNHVGKTSGPMVPDPVAQSEVIADAIRRANIDPRTISYIEAHGTGTSLGDPIELQGLEKAFRKWSSDKQYCAIGSLKSNIGHLEAAAGVAGITKLLLQLKHHEIFPSLHSEELNPYLSFENSSFYMERTHREWKRPEIEVDGKVTVFPRRAGISSFGANGSNAHLIIEEYIPQPSKLASTPHSADPVLVPLSAKSAERLLLSATKLLQHLNGTEDLQSLAYTLQVGREVMNTRVAFVVNSTEELIQKLSAFVEGRSGITNCFQGEAKEGKRSTGSVENLEDRAQLAQQWVEGATVDWNKLYAGTKPRRVHLPTYPFANERYWVPQLEKQVTGNSARTVLAALPSTTYLHPLLHRNTSDLYEQRFSTTLTGSEFFLADHQINGRKVLPGVAYLEMARAAITEAAIAHEEQPDQVRVKLKHVAWASPIHVEEEPVDVHIGLYPEDNGEIAFEVYNGEQEVASQGRLSLSQTTEAPHVDLQALQAACRLREVTAAECYDAFQELGFAYGKGHQAIERVLVGEGQVLARLQLPTTLETTADLYTLHPSLLDAALQSTMLLSGEWPSKQKLRVPFALEELEVFGACASQMWAHVRYSAGSVAGGRVQKLDLDLTDESGNVLVRLKGFSSREFDGDTSSTDPYTTLLFEPAWTEQKASSDAVPDYARHVVFLCEPADGLSERIASELSGAVSITLQSAEAGIAARYQAYALQVFEHLQEIIREKADGNILVQIVTAHQGEQRLFSGLAGMLQTAGLENPKIIGQLIEWDSAQDQGLLVAKLNENRQSPADRLIKYADGTRWVATWREVEVQSPAVQQLPWQEDGVYLITGGAGGLGLVFATEIASHAKQATLVLTGRSQLSAAKLEQLKALEAMGATVAYKQADVADREAADALIQSIVQQYGKLNGIIHSAGVIHDNFILKKTTAEVSGVLAPKVSGIVHLDEASASLPLDFFVFFSSLAGAVGNAGQADYAAANAFMDRYAHYRNGLVAAQQRTGKTLSMNWPLWKEGGMQVHEDTQQMMLRTMGILPLETKTGMELFYQAVATDQHQFVGLQGHATRMKDLLGAKRVVQMTQTPQVKAETPATSTVSAAELSEKAVQYFKKQLSSVLKLPANRIEAKVALEDYGIDSVMIMQLTDELETVFGSLSKTLFFEYQSIQELTQYFLQSHPEQMKELLDLKDKPRAAAAPAQVTAVAEPKPAKGRARGRKRSRFATASTASEPKAATSQDIAIIGLSGRYPGAENLKQFWENLKAGKNSITEIPEDRWNHRLYYDERKNTVGKTYGKWGGFVDGVDQFDPLFFNISPREAEMMDPQERLFLQSAYEAIEDAGYTREGLNGVRDHDLTGNVGVFVGVMYEEYHLYVAQGKGQEQPFAIGGHPASIANRVSYFFNFHGPSLALDTMCSSSLTAIHLACQSLLKKESEVAIAGGVNVSVHPNKYLELAQGSFLSSKGLCESFGAGGDGYVPGEGVGAVLLKPLAKAIADGDHIYGIVKGTAINHGGKTNGYTVPNPIAQAAVIGKALEAAGVHPRTMSYLEAHGTGTSLGDPIEIAGLSRSFKAYTTDNQYCAIGSVKSNIGHCESAAGMSGLTKVLLQMKHGQLVPSLHSQILNPNIDFSQTPFVVQQELAEWKRPIIELDGQTREYPRIAGLSSFGAGGANAHVVIEEYIPTAEASDSTLTITPQNPAVIILSAKTEERLQEQVKQLLTAIREESYSDALLADLAYTLQVGREQMDERLGLIVESVAELEAKLSGYLEKPASAEEVYRGQIKRNKEMLSIFADDDDLQEAVDRWIERRKYTKLLELWVKGLYLDWSKLYTEQRARRISLPTYPFARERYWVPQAKAASNSPSAAATPAVLHPLLHRNTSVLSEQRYSTTLTGQEFFLTDHRVQGRKVLPGAAYLEMARVAVENATGGPGEEAVAFALKNVVWSSPIFVDDEPVEVHIGLYEEDQGDISYEIYREHGEHGERVVYSQGIAEHREDTLAPSLDLDAIRADCNLNVLTSEACYRAFGNMGLEYGEAHRGIDVVYAGQDQALAKLTLASCISGTEQHYVLHPALIDSAIQSSIGLIIGSQEPALPFALEELEVFGPCVSTMWAYVRYMEGSQAGDKVQKLDIDVCDALGNVRVRMSGFTTRLTEKGTPNESTGTLMLEPTWTLQSVDPTTAEPHYSQHLVLLCEADEEVFAHIGGTMSGATCIQLHAEGTGIAERYQAYAAQTLEQLQGIIQSKPQGNVLIQVATSQHGEQQLFAGLKGMLQTARLENPKLITQMIEWEGAHDATARVAQLMENKLSPADQHIRYADGKRWVAGWQEIEALQNLTPQWKDEGVYLITGGAGGLGLIFAEEIARQAQQPVLILTGRSELSAEKQAQLKIVEALGAKVSYQRVDVADAGDVQGLMNSIRAEYGNLNGIIHSAGITKDNYILRKTVGELQQVFAPKVAGVMNLDAGSREFELDFFVLFSSVAGALGNAGQADYAAANAFLDRYAQYRNEQVAANQRRGQTISINWPLWQEGGMQVDAEVEKMMLQNLGLKLLRTGVGIESFQQALSVGTSEVIVVEGHVPTLRTTFGAATSQPVETADEFFLDMIEQMLSSDVEIDQLIGSDWKIS